MILYKNLYIDVKFSQLTYVTLLHLHIIFLLCRLTYKCYHYVTDANAYNSLGIQLPTCICRVSLLHSRYRMIRVSDHRDFSVKFNSEIYCAHFLQARSRDYFEGKRMVGVTIVKVFKDALWMALRTIFSQKCTRL